MIYWDTSALVPVFLQEKDSAKTRAWLKSHKDAPRFTSWLTLFEFEAVLRRKQNQRLISAKEYAAVQEGWSSFQLTLNFIPLDSRSARLGSQLQRLHGLRPYDGIQLGSAALMRLQYQDLRLACLDEKLMQAALQEGIAAVE